MEILNIAVAMGLLLALIVKVALRSDRMADETNDRLVAVEGRLTRIAEDVALLQAERGKLSPEAQATLTRIENAAKGIDDQTPNAGDETPA